MKPIVKLSPVDQGSGAAIPEVTSVLELPARSPLDNQCDVLIELHRQRQDLHKAEKSLTLQIKSKCRRLCDGDKADAGVLYKAMQGKANHSSAAVALAVCQPFLEARAVVHKTRRETEKQMEQRAAELPVAAWVTEVRGLGMGSLAAIVGEAGNLSNYPAPAKLWKRLGLAVINGERQQRRSGAEALEHGYSPSRRSVMWNIGEALFRAGGHYADLCRQRKEIERQKAESEGLVVRPQAKIPKADSDKYRSDGHVHNRAKRYMEKRLVRDIWREWRRVR